MGFKSGYIGHIGAMSAAMALVALQSAESDKALLEIEAPSDLGWKPIRSSYRRKGRTMDEPHIHPPSPFESRQVRRARERRLAKMHTLTTEEQS